MNEVLLKQARRWWQWQGGIASGWRVVLLVVVLVGGRYAWVRANRPAHRMELADAYSINLFYGSPQPDGSGKQLAYVSTADRGFAVFLVDTATGQKRMVQEQNALGPWGSYFDLKVWPWSPDDRWFIYSASNHFYLCAAGTGQVQGEVYVPVAVAALAWTSPDEFVCLGQDHALYRVQKQAGGAWRWQTPWHGVRVAASSQNGPQEGAAQAFDGARETKWYNNNRPGPWWVQYELGSGARRIVWQYRITSANDAPERDPCDWVLQGSNDGQSWTALDTRQGEMFSERFQTKIYSTANTNAYSAYRLYITKQAGADENNMQLSEFSLLATRTNGQAEEICRERDPFAYPVSLQAVSDGAVAWVSQDCLWRLELASHRPVVLLDCQETIARDTHLHKASYSRGNGKYLLSCTREGKPLLYEFDPARGLAAMPTGAGLDNADWLGGASPTSEAFIGQVQQAVVTQRGSKPLVPAALSWAQVESLTLTGNGRQAFLLGVMTNEPAAGLWQFDLESEQLRAVVAYADRPSAHASRIEPLRDFILTGSGKYTLYLPADFYQHPRRKRPLVIGDTDFGFAMRGAYGRMWAPAVAACNGFVVVVNRKDWFGGLDQWGDRVTTAVEELSARLPIDQDRMFLFGVSAETTYLGRFLTNSASRWRGVMLLNPSGLPELSGLSAFRPLPKILVSAGALEHREKQLKAFQLQALQAGVLVELAIAPGEKHHLVGNAAQRQRTRAMLEFIYGD